MPTHNHSTPIHNFMVHNCAKPIQYLDKLYPRQTKPDITNTIHSRTLPIPIHNLAIPYLDKTFQSFTLPLQRLYKASPIHHTSLLSRNITELSITIAQLFFTTPLLNNPSLISTKSMPIPTATVHS